MTIYLIFILILLIIIIIASSAKIDFTNKIARKVGGAALQNIAEYVQKESIQNISKNFKTLFAENKYCDKQLGEGMTGNVRTSTVGKSIDINIGGKKIAIPAAIKDASDEEPTIFNIEKDGEDLYIYTYMNMNMEVLFLGLIRKLWEAKKSPHLPLILGYSVCQSENVSRIITERHGYNKLNMATLADLMDYIKNNAKNGKVKLPNGITCSVTKLLDYLSISYLHTCHLLAENGLSLMDMNTHNIFIQWLDNDLLGKETHVYLGDQDISDTKYIYYKIGKEYIKIETFGLILKIGDVGASMYTTKKGDNNVYIFGQCSSLDECKELGKLFGKTAASEYILGAMTELPIKLKKETVLWNLLINPPFDEYSADLTAEILNKSPKPIEILKKHYAKYKTKKINKTNAIIC